MTDQDHVKKDKSGVIKNNNNSSYFLAVVSIIVALIMTRLSLLDLIFPHPGVDGMAERLIREKLIKCYNVAEPKKSSEIGNVMKDIKGKEKDFIEKLHKKYHRYEECDPKATGLLTATKQPPSPSKKEKKVKKLKKEKKQKEIKEDPLDEDPLDEDLPPEPMAEYIGCYGTENVFANKKYGGGSNGAYYQLALAQASKEGKKYFAIARHEYDGHSFSFSDFTPNHMEYLTEGEGCDRACIDVQSQSCGCVDDLCDGPPLPGEEHNRRWAVYAITG